MTMRVGVLQCSEHEYRKILCDIEVRVTDLQILQLESRIFQPKLVYLCNRGLVIPNPNINLVCTVLL